MFTVIVIVAIIAFLALAGWWAWGEKETKTYLVIAGFALLMGITSVLPDDVQVRLHLPMLVEQISKPSYFPNPHIPGS